MGNNIDKQTNSSQASNKNTTNNNTINNTTNNANNTTNNTTNTSQNNDSINNCTSSNSRIITNDPNENLNHIIQTGIETAQNIQFNLSQNRVTYIKPLSTSSINVTETTTAPSEAGTPSTTSAPPTTSVPPTANPCENIFQNISQTSTLLQNINNIREQLARLNIDPSQRIYYENCVVPLLTTLYELSASSATLATSVNFLATSPVVHSKTSQLRDTTHLIYHINEKCEDVYKVLKKRIDIMLDMC
ncbi:hypothetical protein [Clostridium sp. OS1-26]|uniref:hypothetical protein n=1 Tax=Clostridium sp. OS1-26 TaxID=3070681 RepID=UPI0027E1C3E7|nr:hypothetical protein [Clostridium sp. OS1-26]WML37277.1 hypothetical protein RCG18_12055 [Clostridium sp. OS1-26]